MKWSDIGDKIKTWHVVLLFVILVCGGTFKIVTAIYAFDNRKADRVEVAAVSQQIQAITINIERANIQKQIWEIEDRFHCGPRYGNSCYNVIQDKTICKSLLNLQENLKQKQNMLNRLTN